MFPVEIWDSPEAFASAGIRGYEPMTAKELDTEEKQDAQFKNPANFIEEKFDGTRALVYFLSQPTTEGEDTGFCRIFSRRISKKTGFYAENTDRLPHLRDLDVPELEGTILDGEMFIEGLPFKDVSSVMNCLPEEAVERQKEKGFVTFHAFDILFYNGIDVRKVPLSKRKEYLSLAVKDAGSEYIKAVPYFHCGDTIGSTIASFVDEETVCLLNKKLEEYQLSAFPDLENYLSRYQSNKSLELSPRAYYELIVSLGGEGVIVKDSSGKYFHKRGWEYSKVKKFFTREMVVLAYGEPTKEYTGKDKKHWGFWIRKSDGEKLQGNFFGDEDYMPVTRHYFYSQIGTLRLGVLISPEDLESIPEKKRGALFNPSDYSVDVPEGYQFMEVCECSGFDDATRSHFSSKRDEMLGEVVEVKANELFKDTGKLRHPRYLWRRNDKGPEDCVWETHVGKEG